MEKIDNQKDTKPKTINRWLDFCKKVASENPDLAYKDVLRKAKESYIKIEKPIKEKLVKTRKLKPKSDTVQEIE